MLRPPEFCRTVAALQAERHDDLDDDRSIAGLLLN
jgi:hypothetical protein